MLLKTQLVNARDRKKKGCRAASCHGGTAYAGASPVPYGTGQAPALRRYPNTPSQEEPCLYANQPNLRTGTVTLAHHPPPLLCRGGESFSWQSLMPPAAPRNHENSCAAQRRSAGVSPAVARASRPRRTSRARCPRHGGRDARATIFKAAKNLALSDFPLCPFRMAEGWLSLSNAVRLHCACGRRRVTPFQSVRFSVSALTQCPTNGRFPRFN